MMIVLIAFSGATTLVDDSQAFQTYSTLYRRGQGEQATSTSVFALGLHIITLPELRSPYQIMSTRIKTPPPPPHTRRSGPEGPEDFQ